MFCVIMMSFRNVVNTLENMDVGKIIHVVRLVGLVWFVLFNDIRSQ